MRCRLRGNTNRPDRRPVTMDREVILAPTDDPQVEILKALGSRRDKGRPFIGDSVTLETPEGTTQYVVEEGIVSHLRLEKISD